MENQHILRSEPKKHLVIYPILLSPLLPSFLTMPSHQQLRPQHPQPRLLRLQGVAGPPYSAAACVSKPLPEKGQLPPTQCKLRLSPQFQGRLEFTTAWRVSRASGYTCLLSFRGQEKQLSSYKHTGCSSRGTGSDLQVVYSKVKQSTVPGDPTPSSGLCSLTHM